MIQIFRFCYHFSSHNFPSFLNFFPRKKKEKKGEVHLGHLVSLPTTRPYQKKKNSLKSNSVQTTPTIPLEHLKYQTRKQATKKTEAVTGTAPATWAMALGPKGSKPF